MVEQPLVYHSFLKIATKIYPDFQAFFFLFFHKKGHPPAGRFQPMGQP